MMHLAQTLLGALTGDIEQHVGAAKRNTILYALMAVLGLGAYGFGLAALAIYLAAEYGPIAAMLALCALNLFLLAAVLITQKVMQSQTRRRIEARHRSDAIMLASLGVSLLPMMVKSKPLGLLAALGGLAFAGSKLTTGGQSEDPHAERARLEAELAELENAVSQLKPNGHYHEQGVRQ